jgi:tetratricopeptide (TPR) repeat protein
VKRTVLAALLVLLTGVLVAVAYNAAARDRAFRQLIGEGDAAVSGGQLVVAIEAFSGAIALKPDSMLAYLKRGEAYHHQGDLKAALRDLRTASLLDPTATRPLEELGDVNYGLERYPRAAELYAAFVAIDDRSPRVLYKLALAHFRSGEARAAIRPLRSALQQNDRFPEAHYLLGLCLRAGRQPAEAVGALRRALELSPLMTPPREELADLYLAMGRTADRLEQLEMLTALEPERPERHIALGLAAARAGRLDLAVVALGRAAERHPEHSAVYAALGEVWLQVAESEVDQVALGKSLQALRTMVARGAPGSHGLTTYGRALLASGNPDGARQALREAVAKLPVDPDAYLHLATAAQRLGAHAEARDALIRYAALASPPVTAPVAVRIADLSDRLRDPQTAAQWLSSAVKAAPNNVDLRVRLIESLRAVGDWDAARTAVGAALVRDPSDARLARLKASLAGGPGR